MNIRVIFLIIISIFLTACPGSEPTNINPLNTNTTNANTIKTNTNSPMNTTKKPEEATTNNAPTLAPVVAAYYDALKKKDDAGIRKVMSAEFIKTIEADMKAENKTNLAAYLAEIDTIPEKPVEVRNEKIEGDKATAELKGGMNVNWTNYVFRKEGGAWKITTESEDISNVDKTKTSNTSNTAK